jgi:hypothetical protein
MTIPPGVPADGYVAFTSESIYGTGSVIALDSDGRELGRTGTDFQDISQVSSSSTALVLWGDLSNDIGVVSRDGSIQRTHSLDR